MSEVTRRQGRELGEQDLEIAGLRAAARALLDALPRCACRHCNYPHVMEGHMIACPRRTADAEIKALEALL